MVFESSLSLAHAGANATHQKGTYGKVVCAKEISTNWYLVDIFLNNCCHYHMSQIQPNLYLAGIEETMHECEHHNNGVTHILNVASEIVADRSDKYTYKHCGVCDDHPQKDITIILDECVDWIDGAIQQGGTVWVHCWSGVSRSACVIMAYLVARQGYSAVDAFQMVLARRPIIDPWPRYLSQFQEWAKP